MDSCTATILALFVLTNDCRLSLSSLTPCRLINRSSKQAVENSGISLQSLLRYYSSWSMEILLTVCICVKIFRYCYDVLTPSPPQSYYSAMASRTSSRLDDNFTVTAFPHEVCCLLGIRIAYLSALQCSRTGTLTDDPRFDEFL